MCLCVSVASKSSVVYGVKEIVSLDVSLYGLNSGRYIRRTRLSFTVFKVLRSFFFCSAYA